MFSFTNFLYQFLLFLFLYPESALKGYFFDILEIDILVQIDNPCHSCNSHIHQNLVFAVPLQNTNIKIGELPMWVYGFKSNISPLWEHQKCLLN